MCSDCATVNTLVRWKVYEIVTDQNLQGGKKHFEADGLVALLPACLDLGHLHFLGYLLKIQYIEYFPSSTVLKAELLSQRTS